MILGNKVLICGLTKDVEGDVLRWVNQPELRDLTGTGFPVSEYEHESWVRRKAEAISEKLFVIRDKKSNVAIGIIGLSSIDYVNSRAELYIRIGDGTYMSTNTVKNGYGSDAVITLTDFCFLHMNLHKVYLNVFESNTRAIECYKKSGFEVEGHLKEHHFCNGKFEDVLVMSKLRQQD